MNKESVMQTKKWNTQQVEKHLVEGLLSTNVIDFLPSMLFLQQRAIFVCRWQQFHIQILFLDPSLFFSID